MTTLTADAVCEAGKRASFGGRWTEPCNRYGRHAIANEGIDPIVLCDEHFAQVERAGLVTDVNIGWGEFLRHEEQRMANFDVALQVTDEVMGYGAYERLNRNHPDPEIQAAIARWRTQPRTVTGVVEALGHIVEEWDR